jgi:hypothetical protein
MRSLAARLSQPLQYDAPRRRLWILGQRCHHGATGSLMAAAGCLGLQRDDGARLEGPRDLV